MQEAWLLLLNLSSPLKFTPYLCQITLGPWHLPEDVHRKNFLSLLLYLKNLLWAVIKPQPLMELTQLYPYNGNMKTLSAQF